MARPRGTASLGVDLPDLLTRIEFDQLQRGFDLPESGANWVNLNFRKMLGCPDKLSYTARIFGMKKGTEYRVPHGHHNLVSCHLVVKGDLHVRNYERLRDEAESLIIRPTIDKAISIRDCSTQSSLRNNVHWFTALSSTAFTFDVFVQDLDRDQPSGVDFIDPEHAENLGDGTSVHADCRQTKHASCMGAVYTTKGYNCGPGQVAPQSPLTCCLSQKGNFPQEVGWVDC